VSEPVNILLVDDQPQRLLSYEAVLAPLGERLVRAGSAREALDVLLRQDIAVVLVDVVMPEMDGFELATVVREHPRFRNTPIIFVTAISTSEMELLKGYETGAVDYVRVPIVPEVLRAKVAVFAELYRKSRDLQSLNRELEERVAERTADLERTLSQLTERAAQLEQEIAERKRAEAVVQEVNRNKDNFIAILAHELRNPLAPIRNAVAVLKHAGLADPSLQWCRDVIERQVGQMSHLLEDLLDVGRINSGKLTLRRCRTELAAVIEQAIETTRPLIDARKHELVLDVPPEPIWLDADPVRLAQVFLNLLGNSAKYTEPGGRIELRAQREGTRAIVRVTDSGIGITPENLQRVFEMFGQVESAADRSPSGLGIGLMLVKLLVDLHGGTIEVRSEGLNRGSEFVVSLPAVAAPSAQPQAPASAPPAGAGVKRRILVADDNRDAADSLAMLLEILGHEVRTVYDGQQAIQAAEKFRPGLVLLDIGMPGLDGYAAARRIRDQQSADKPLLVALTGWGREEDRRRSREAGFDAHLVKPVDQAALLQLVANLPPPAVETPVDSKARG